VRNNQTIARTIQSLLLAVVFASRWNPAWSQNTASAKDQSEISAGYKEFLDRVQSYVSLHKTIELSLPALKPTDLPELISAHQQALARKIREARTNAKRGDIFTENARRAFRDSVRNEFHGANARNARTTIRQGAPLKEIHLHVNEPYPDGVPFTTSANFIAEISEAARSGGISNRRS
jgi:hypothetical protein